MKHAACLCIARVTAILVVFFLSSPVNAQLEHFVTARHDSLMDGEHLFRFISINVPNLHYIEDNFPFDQPNPWRIADEYEIKDALTTIKQMGGKVIRMYVPSVRKEIDAPDIVRHVEGPGKFNEEAFRAYDRVLQLANQLGIRVIIPLVDNWWWWGGPKEYAAFRGKTREEFWTDTLLIADFKKTVNFIVNRVNTLTGMPFKEDRAILGWETGNELEAPYSWTKEIAAYIKTLDPNHLVIEGTHDNGISDEALADSNIDVLSTHHYTRRNETIARILAARDKARGKKPYFIGEFGFLPIADMRQILETVISSGVSGIMLWSLRTHNRDGGFYYHGIAYRWPGFESDKPWDEPAVMTLLHEKAYQIDGMLPDPLPPPLPPTMLPLETPYKISWQGSTGASSYFVERKSDSEFLWSVIAVKVSDAAFGYRPLFSDTAVELGKRYSYRVRAKSASGYSEPSEPVGPVAATYRMLIDEMGGDSKAVRSSDAVTQVPPGDAMKAREDWSRVAGRDGESILYTLPDVINSVKLDYFITDNNRETTIRLFSGDSTRTFFPLVSAKQVIEPYGNEYGMYTAVSLTCHDIPFTHRLVKVVFVGNTQLSRIEVTYGKLK